MVRGPVLLICLPLLSLFSLINPNQFNSNKIGIKTQITSRFFLSEDPKCTDCHGDLKEKKHIHEPAKDACDNCHQIDITEHSQNSSKGLGLTEKIPELCFTCHDGSKKDIDTSRLVHKALSEKKQCMNCHSPHSSDEKKLLIADKNELCLGCHDKDIDADGKKLTNIRQLLKTSKVIHPGLTGGCTVCHKPHASTENYLLISSYPAGQYAQGKKDNYAFCWECHDSDLLEVAKTTTSTGFRDGDRNLHFVHLNGEKGRSCSICHDVHATRNEHLIVDKVPFGEWELPVNYVPADSGGSCFPGCHRQYKYTR